MLRVIDVASHQAGIVTGQVDCDAVICKATEGTGYVNPYCDEHYQSAKAAGKCLGVYHYASGGDPVAEADFFLDNIQGYIGEAILVLDWESGDNTAWGNSNWVKQFCERIVAKTGIKPMIYCQQSSLNQVTGLGDYGLWVAQYGSMDVTGWEDNPWNTIQVEYAMHQYTSNGRVSGYSQRLDLSIFYGDRVAWNAYAGVGNTTEPVENQNGSPEGSTLDLLYRTMNDEFGTGETRKINLGARYDEIQNIIEHIYSVDAQTLAAEVWADNYGSGEVRRAILGSRYDEVQNIVDGNGANNEVYHRIEDGDTLTAIAVQYNTTVSNILALNPWITNPDIIYIGQTIRVC